ncbi:MAG: hypothetical protein EZS28_052100, partial [Streblomastix strix]
MEDIASQSTINSYRDIVISQISQIVTLIAQGMKLNPLNDNAIFVADKYTSDIFRNTSYILNIDYQKNVLTELMNLLVNIERRLQYGTHGREQIEPSGDPFVDSYNLPRLQGSDTQIDEIMMANTECLYTVDVYDDFQKLCDVEDRIGPYITIPF